MNKPLPRQTPESLGIDPAALLRFLDAVEQEGLELHGFMLMRHGVVAAEGWWDPYGPRRPHELFSLSKSFTSTAVGFAVSEGLLTVDDPVIRFFPEYAGDLTGYWQDLRVRHLLTMSTGHQKDTTGYMVRRRDGDWAGAFFSRPLRYEPGTYFLYNSGATYMLSAIVQRLTGQRVSEYLTPRLFEPLGIEGAFWEQCPRGIDTGGWGLFLRTEDIMRFGKFLLQKGRWEDRELLPARWVEEATRKHIDNGPVPNTDWEQGYGYQFWRCRHDCYRGDGAFGQYCIVMPRQDAVIAINSGVGNMQSVLDALWAHVLPAMGEDVPEDAPGASMALTDSLAGLRYDPSATTRRPELENSLSGRTIRFGRNRFNYRTVSIDFNEERCAVTIEAGGSRTTMDCGYGRWVESRGLVLHPCAIRAPRLDTAATAAACRWAGDTLAVRIKLVETPFTVEMQFTFDGDDVRMKVDNHMGGNIMPYVSITGKLLS